MKVFPFAALAVIAALAAFGARQGVYRHVDDQTVCAYAVADLAAPPATVLLVGASRFGQGLDPVYMQDRIAARSGQDVTVERMVLNTPNIPQFRPLLARYIAQRGAPDHVVLPLLYNFNPERQRGWDLPVNNLRNVTYAPLADLAAIQAQARLNVHDTALPRRFEAGFTSWIAMALQKLEINVYAALRWPMVNGATQALCAGDDKFRQGRAQVFGTVDDSTAFRDNDRAQARRARDIKRAARFLPPAPLDPARQFETDQLRQLIALMEDAGSTVTLIVMPALGDTEITPDEEAEIGAAFPGTRFIHPYGLFQTDLGPELAKSYSDTHHATPYGALIYSRFFADALTEAGL